MVCCLLCFSDGPVEDDPRGAFPNTFETSFLNAPCKAPGSFCVAMLCTPCMAYHLRIKALELVHPDDPWQEHYECGQGCSICCLKSGTHEKMCPDLCICCEVYCCIGVAISGTRNYLMDSFEIQSDPCDNRLIRFNNCLQMFACICSILSIVDPSFRDLAQILDLIADTVFCIISSCMQAQTNLEIAKRTKASVGVGAPPNEKMER